jgi:hypothetical protein
MKSNDLGRGVRITLIQSGERPAVLAGPAALAIETRPALERWKPQAQHHSLALGLRLARELAGKTGRILVFSDESPEGEMEGVQWIAAGEPLGNVGIIGAQRTLSTDAGKGTISLTLGNSSTQEAKRQLRLVVDGVDGKDLLAQEISVPPRVSSMNLPIPAGLPAVTVALSSDALQRDNDVTLVEPRPQIVSIDNRLPKGRGHDALDRALRSIAGVTRSEQAQLVFGPASLLDPPPEPGVWRVGFWASPPALPGHRKSSGSHRSFYSGKTPSPVAGDNACGSRLGRRFACESVGGASCSFFRKPAADRPAGLAS